jgi:hypothetical protein
MTSKIKEECRSVQGCAMLHPEGHDLEWISVTMGRTEWLSGGLRGGFWTGSLYTTELLVTLIHHFSLFYLNLYFLLSFCFFFLLSIAL